MTEISCTDLHQETLERGGVPVEEATVPVTYVHRSEDIPVRVSATRENIKVDRKNIGVRPAGV